MSANGRSSTGTSICVCAFALAHVISPCRRAERFNEQPGLRYVLVELPAQRPVAAADRGQVLHGGHERLGVFVGHHVLDRDENGTVVVVEVRDDYGVLPVARRLGRRPLARRQRDDPPEHHRRHERACGDQQRGAQ